MKANQVEEQINARLLEINLWLSIILFSSQSLWMYLIKFENHLHITFKICFYIYFNNLVLQLLLCESNIDAFQ